jgi:tetratricopeptide (TPR) repeat protein
MERESSMFEKAVTLSPNEHLQARNLADAYRALGQRKKATAIYDRAIKLAFEAYQVNPRSANTLGSMALYSAKKENLNRAHNFIARARH